MRDEGRGIDLLGSIKERLTVNTPPSKMDVHILYKYKPRVGWLGGRCGWEAHLQGVGAESGSQHQMQWLVDEYWKWWDGRPHFQHIWSHLLTLPNTCPIPRWDLMDLSSLFDWMHCSVLVTYRRLIMKLSD